MRLISVVGAAPGIGKSTFCQQLVAGLRAGGERVDHFAEAEIMTRPVYAVAAQQFRDTGFIQPRVLVDCTVTYLRQAAAAGVQVVVADALTPFVPSLLAFGHREQDIVEIVRELAAQLPDVRAEVMFLDGDVATALNRAATREGPDWLAWYTTKLARYHLLPDRPTDTDLHTYLAHQRATTLRVATALGWPVTILPVT